jgi:hypothetical protein
MAPAVAVAVTRRLAVSAETVPQIAAPVMVEMPQQELLESMVEAAAAARVDQEIQQVLQAVMALYLLPLIFSLELLTTAIVQPVEHQL